MLPRSHDELVARLSGGVTPVVGLRPPLVRLAWWLALQAVTLGSAFLFGLREDLALHLHDGRFLLELVAFIAAGSIAGGIALSAAVPGMTKGRGTLAIPLVIGAFAFALLSLEPALSGNRSTGRFLFEGMRCVGAIASFSALPWVALFIAVRRGAPLDRNYAATCTGAAALLFAAAAVRIACPVDDGLHLLFWHTVPISLGISLAGTLTARWLEPLAAD
ncbi:MAG TPA: NrsF family protein [Candidatus Binatia bacterium]|jgi:hypothetical protein